MGTPTTSTDAPRTPRRWRPQAGPAGCAAAGAGTVPGSAPYRLSTPTHGARVALLPVEVASEREAEQAEACYPEGRGITTGLP